jgi:leucyl aminopeptidase (aminopeptidase T)
MIRGTVLPAMMTALCCAGTLLPVALSHEPTVHAVLDPPAAIDRHAVATMIAKSGAIRIGDLVWIDGPAQDAELMERIAVAVVAAGGHPLVTVFSGEMLRGLNDYVPAQFDARRDEWLWQISQLVDVEMRVGSISSEDWDAFEPSRRNAWAGANAAARAVRRERDVRLVYVGNGTVNPADWRARTLGLEREELDRIFDEGVMAEPAVLAAAGAPLLDILRGASSVRVRHPNGTDLTVGVAGSTRVVLSDGTTMPPPRAPGQEDELNITWLPAGEVTLGLDPERADGRLVLERFFLSDKAVAPLTLDYSEGRLVSMESEADLTGLRAYMQSALPLSERLTGLKFGLNTHVTDARVLPLMGAGMVSLSLGQNLVLGGDIDLPFLIFLTLPGTTVEVDGRVVVEDGVLAYGPDDR